MVQHFLEVDGSKINISKINDKDYFCLTDMVKNIEGGQSLIEKWLRNKNTLEFLGMWEMLNNPSFNREEYERIQSDAGLNRFVISAKQWAQRTNAIGIAAKAGRYGGTYAHKDIAFEFGSWISPVFKLYLIKEYQIQQDREHDPMLIEWDVRRVLTKVNYVLHTEAIKNFIIPKTDFKDLKHSWIYASEADALNLVVFGYTAKMWRDANPKLAAKNLNIRDTATINQLVVCANIESYNAQLIRDGLGIEERKRILHKAAKEQLRTLNESNADHKFKKLEGRIPLALDE